jgi:hypothetical protein
MNETPNLDDAPFPAIDRDRAGYLVDRYSERKETAEKLVKRVTLTAAT